MRLRTALLAAALGACTLGSVPAARADDGATCVDRQCKIEAANQYLAALVSHDGSQVPLHPEAWRQENGGERLEGGDNIRVGLEHPIMYVITGIHDLRWWVDGEQVVAVYDLDTVAPTVIFERFLVDGDGLIREIDAHFVTDVKGHVSGPESVASNPGGRTEALFGSNHGPAGPVPMTDGDTGDDGDRPGDEAGVADLVDTFLAAMASGDLTEIRLVDGAVQTINRSPIDDILGELVAESATIAATTSRIIVVDGAEATALYEIELESGGRLFGATRFATVDGAIAELEAVCDAAYESQVDPTDRLRCS